MVAVGDREVYVIDEVVHFGGFFAGDTVGLTAHPKDEPENVKSLTVDDHVWDNLKDKHNLQPGMALALRFHLGDPVEASVLGHPDREQLRQAIKERNISPNPALRAIAYHCKQCGLWIALEPAEDGSGYACAVCGAPLATS